MPAKEKIKIAELKNMTKTLVSFFLINFRVITQKHSFLTASFLFQAGQETIRKLLFGELIKKRREQDRNQ